MEVVNVSNMLQHSDKRRAEKHVSGGGVKPGNASHKWYLIESRRIIVGRLSGRASPFKSYHGQRKTMACSKTDLHIAGMSRTQ